VVTGGTRGIGLGIAKTLAAYGASVLVASRSEADCRRTAAELTAPGSRCLGVSADVSAEVDVEKIMDTAVKEFGGLDILVNNAGIGGKTAPVLEQEEADWQKVIDINLKSVFLCAKAATTRMISQNRGGRIINIASIGGIVGGQSVAPYSAAKAGVISLTKTMAKEWARYGIMVNAVCPGYIITDLNQDVLADPVVLEKLSKKIPLRRLAGINEVLGAVLLLAGECSSFMTGSIIIVDGGATIGG
jgi:gluconate 5-dehydrogenase